MRAVLFALAAMAFFSTMGVFIRLAGEHVHVLETVFLRNFLALPLMAPWMLRRGRSALRTRRIGLLAARSGVNILGTVAGFTAITMIPLAEATALSFTTPLFAALGAALLLGETVGARRAAALAAGFAGVLLVLRPGAEAVSAGALLALAGALCIAGTVLIVKKLTETERPETIVVYMALLQSPLALVPALFVWEWPSAEGWLWLFCLAGAGTAGHLCYTRALAAAEVSRVQPFDFVRLPLMAAFGFVLFGEEPTVWTWVGGAVICASTAYIAHREARLARAARR